MISNMEIQREKAFNEWVGANESDLISEFNNAHQEEFNEYCEEQFNEFINAGGDEKWN